MKELRPAKETYYLLDSVSEDNLEDDFERLNDEINKCELFLQYCELEMRASLDPALTSSSKHTLHLLYKNDDKQEKELDFGLSSNLVIKNNFKNKETDIVRLSDANMFGWINGYYKIGEQYLVPASSL